MSQLAVMLLVFTVAIIPGLASRRMERSDCLTLIAIPLAMFPVAVLPSIFVVGFTKDTATYILGMLFVAVVATVNYRLQPKVKTAAEPQPPHGVTGVHAASVAKET